MRSMMLMVLAAALASVLFTCPVLGNDYQGTTRIGYTFTDIEGNHGVHQPTFNLYEGVAFTLEQFRYQWDNGLRLSANIVNPFLNNRRLGIGFGKTGIGGLNLNHTSYRRTYGFDGAVFTRRQVTSTSAWLRPVRYLRLYSGFGYTDKHGRSLNFFEPEPGTGINETDYSRVSFQGGVEFKHRRSYAQVEYQMADFRDDMNTRNDRKSQRLRLTFYSPIPKYENVVVSGGFQHFTNKLENTIDTLKANTFWGAARYGHKLGYHLRYSVMFDRARRTRDLTSTDNIIHRIHAGKTWRGRGGLTAGYGYRLNDDAKVKRSGDEYSLTGWFRPIDDLMLRVGIDFESDVVDSGRVLTGDRDFARHWLSAKYRVDSGFIRFKLEDRQKNQDDIGSSADFIRLSSDFSISIKKFGDVIASYAYGYGEYSNSLGVFEYAEHTISGEVFSREYRRFQAGFRGMYYHSQRNVDVESFTLEFTGRYGIFKKTKLEFVYSVHNFDDLNDPAEFYDQYYTANVVTAVIVYEL